MCISPSYVVQTLTMIQIVNVRYFVAVLTTISTTSTTARFTTPSTTDTTTTTPTTTTTSRTTATTSRPVIRPLSSTSAVVNASIKPPSSGGGSTSRGYSTALNGSDSEQLQERLSTTQGQKDNQGHRPIPGIIPTRFNEYPVNGFNNIRRN